MSDISFEDMALTSKQQIQILSALRKLELLQVMELEEIRLLRRNPRFWVNPFLAKRQKYDVEAHLLKDLLWDDGKDYKNFCRMTIANFEHLLSLVEETIQKKNTRMRYAIPARTRLAITLRYIATGDSYRSLEFLVRVSRKTISEFMPEVLSAIYDSLHRVNLQIPKNGSEWLKIAEDYNNIWDFPHTLGAIDGKHMRIKAPPQSGSDFFNYKGFFSIVLLAVVNAHSKFIYIDVGCNGRASDNIIYKQSTLYNALRTDTLNIPPPLKLKGQDVPTPFYFIGDDIFGLDKNLMKAYNKNSNLNVQQEIFNYRISRARMTVEMAFGRLVSRFRIFHRPMEVSLSTCDAVVKVCCALHNYLSQDIKIAPESEESIKLPDTITPLISQECNSYKFSCRIRDTISRYCVTDGDVPFQWKKIKRTM